MTGPPFALFDFNYVQFLVNCLAVGGGFLVGYLSAGAVAWWIDRTFLRKKTPPTLHRASRILGGLALAIIVALLLFGKGGTGLGGGQGEGLGSGTGATGTGPTAEPVETKPKPPAPAKDVPIPTARIRVTMLGGADVKDKRFYLIDDDSAPKTFEEAKSAIRAKADAAPEKPAVEVRFTVRNALPQDHPAVRQLADWARESGLTVVYPAEG